MTTTHNARYKAIELVATHSFYGDASKCQLSFAAGATIRANLDQEKNGWQWGSLPDGCKGWFPSSYAVLAARPLQVHEAAPTRESHRLVDRVGDGQLHAAADAGMSENKALIMGGNSGSLRVHHSPEGSNDGTTTCGYENGQQALGGSSNPGTHTHSMYVERPIFSSQSVDQVYADNSKESALSGPVGLTNSEKETPGTTGKARLKKVAADLSEAGIINLKISASDAGRKAKAASGKSAGKLTKLFRNKASKQQSAKPSMKPRVHPGDHSEYPDFY